MQKKKILMLGGSFQQMVAIETAKRMGYETILCDFLPDNPGQQVADKFYLESTTDKEKILQIATEEKISGILAYASDPAAPTAAYVAEKLGLPGSPYKSVDILCDKEKFRAFLKAHDFCTPEAKGYGDVETALEDLKNGTFRLPVLVKPVDSSGSKGVSLIEDTDAAEDLLRYAFGFSRSKRIIIEEYVEKYGYQIAGDGLSVDGKLVFRCFGNDHFDPVGENPFVPISASFPYNMPDWVQEKIHNEIQRLLTLLHMGTTTYNFDMRIDKDYNVYLMEIAPRDGGNYIPQIIKRCTGIDLVEISVLAAMGEEIKLPEHIEEKGFISYYAVHSHKEGVLKKIHFAENVERDHIVENYIVRNPGDFIYKFSGSYRSLGILLMQFESMEQMLYMMDHSEEWIEIELEEK